MRRWSALPAPGGLLDQEERLMRRLDLVRDLEDEYTAEREAIARAKADAGDALRRLPGLRSSGAKVYRRDNSG